MKNPAKIDYLIDLILRSARIAAIVAIFYAFAIYAGANRQKIGFALLGVVIFGFSTILLNKYGVKHQD